MGYYAVETFQRMGSCGDFGGCQSPVRPLNISAQSVYRNELSVSVNQGLECKM